ncbi:hypothetical protein [Bacillus toyonensis]|uniref:hypothetical protein n=1 Tax=Bacillus toyonensis TaxID=155322 RepID=UPI002E22480D|nr:hypothetical protein [Bacillus toyonensis]
MKAELFEVKSGDNKGVYLKVDNTIPRDDQFDLILKGLQAGYINSYNVGFYRRHGAANKKTLQSLNTFDQLATIWRLNPYGIGNQDTLVYKGQKICETIAKLESIYLKAVFTPVNI